MNITVHAVLTHNTSLACQAPVVFIIHDIPEKPVLVRGQNWSGETVPTVIHVNESSALLSSIGNRIQFIDPDLNDTHAFSLSCVGSQLACPFAIMDSGQIYLANTDGFDYEQQDQWMIRIRITDSHGLYDEMFVTVNLIDENEPPVFSQQIVYRVGNYPIRLYEAIGNPVVATDPEQNIVEYTITDSSFFVIDQTGQIRLASLLLNPHMSYNVTVRAIDAGGLDDSVLVIISFNTRDSSLQVNSELFTVPENHTIRVPLRPAISASGSFMLPLHFELSSDAVPFVIDSATGQLSHEAALDFELRNYYVFTVTVTDYYGIQASGNVTVIVTDVNEPPQLSGTSCTVYRSIVEESAENTFIYPPIVATDADRDDTLSYSIAPLHNSDQIPLSVHPALGLLFVSNSSLLTYDRGHCVEFSVVVSDSQNLTDSCLVHVEVIRKNRPPQIHWIQSDLFVNEDAEPGLSLPISIYASDDEDLTYSLYTHPDGTDTNSTFPFQFDGTLLSLQLLYPLDYEETPQYNATLCVEDSVQQQSCREITIHVVDVNEPPNFDPHQYAIAVPEDTPLGTHLTTVHASDPEQQQIYFSSENSVVSVDRSSGEVLLTSRLDYETSPFHNITIHATDELGLSSQTLLLLHVLDVNEPPICLNDHMTARVLETAQVGDIIARVNVSDAEVDTGSQSLTYSLLSNHTQFNVNDSGDITLVEPLNFWNQSYFLLRILVSDNGTPVLSTQCSIHIQVVDINDPPTLHGPSVIHVAEDAPVFVPLDAEFWAEDRDAGQQLLFSISDNPQFGVDPIAGTLFLKQPLDYETTNVYSFTVSVQDTSPSPLSDSLAVTVLVDDVNEPPQLVATAFAVPEDTAPNSVIGAIAYYDPDKGVNGTVYCIQQSHPDRFAIDSTTCRVTTKTAMDYEREKEYNIFLRLVDGGGLFTVGTIRVNIVDVNEPPVIRIPSNNATVQVDSPIDSLLDFAIVITDPENDWIQVSLSQATMPLPIRIAHIDGDRYGLVVNDTLLSSFAVSLSARDSHGLTSTERIFVTVIFSQPLLPAVNPVSCFLLEHSPAPTRLENCTLRVENAYLFANATFEKQFSIATDDFEIQQQASDTALVVAISEVDFEVMQQYVIPYTVEAITYSGDVVAAHSVIVVDIIDVNEPPCFDEEPAIVRVEENSQRGSLLRPCLRARDPDDADRELPISYSISSDNHWIGIQEDTGCLFVKQDGLDYEDALQPKEFNLLVEATDVHGASSNRTICVEVLDVNEPPTFSSPAFYFAITAPAPPNTTVGYPLPVSDEDANSTFSFSIQQQSCAEGFVIDPSSGQLSTGPLQIPAFAPSSEGNVTCIIHVKAVDNGELAAHAIVYVTIVSSILPPVILTDVLVIAENPPLHANIGTLSATSMCSTVTGEIHYLVLQSPYSSLVSLDGSALRVTQPDLFDYESLPSFPLQIMAIDKTCFNTTATKWITITLADVNEPPTVSSVLYHVYPGAAYPLTLSPPISAVDPEGASLHFSLSTANPNITISDQGTVQLLGDLTAPLPEEPGTEPHLTTHRFTFPALVSEAGPDALSSTFNITVDVDRLHFGDHGSPPPPALSFKEGTNTTRTVPEDTPIGSPIGAPFEIDTDDPNPTLFFSIQSCSPSCPTLIHSVTGQLILSSSLDFEAVPHYELNITVANGFTSSWIRVSLLVGDVDDCVVTSVAPAELALSENHILLTGQNLAPKGRLPGLSGVLATGESYSAHFVAHYSVFDHLSGLVGEGVLEQCAVVETDEVDCVLPGSMGAYVQLEVAWNSSLPGAVQHHCSLPRERIPFKSVVLREVKNATAMSTSGWGICFAGENMGTSALHSSAPAVPISASALLVDGTETSLSSCSCSSVGDICCSVGDGYGSTVVWTLCLFGSCSSLQDGSFAAPRISSVTAPSSLNCLGGDDITISGSHFAANISVVTVLMGSAGSQSPLAQCHYVVPHAVIGCKSVEGSGENIIFTVVVSDQHSPAFESSLAYNAPTIHSVYGVGSVNASTSGGQAVFVSGANLGAADGAIRLLYGNSTELSFASSPCHTVLPHTLLRCITAPGSGYQDRWVVAVENQRSQPFVQQSGIYGAPAVMEVDKLHELLPTQGGMEIVITGLNFGDDASLVHVEYENEFGDQFFPLCTILTNHTQLECVSVAGFGAEVRWTIEVNGLVAEDVFTMSYATPAIASVECKVAGCGRLSGGESIVLSGSDLGSLLARVDATYGMSGTEFEATECHVVSTSAIECVTAPGVGQDLIWRVSVSGQPALVSQDVTFSYFRTTIDYRLGAALTLKGGDELLMHVSNDFTACAGCFFQMTFNGVAVDAEVVNSTDLYALTPTIQSVSLSVQVIVYHNQYIVETTNIVPVPLETPRITSTMILPGIDYSYHLLSLVGENFGFLSSVISIHVSTPEGVEAVCEKEKTSNDFVSCRTTLSRGAVFLRRGEAVSNVAEFATSSVEFITSNFTTSIEGYLVYPHLFNTTGGEQLTIYGEGLPSSLEVTIGTSQCMISSLNTTFVSCIVPPGEGRFLPVRILSNNQILLQLFLSYYPPTISTVYPSSLQFDTSLIQIEGSNFGLHPTLLLSGVSSGSIDCSIRSHTHTWIQCALGNVDPLGVVLQLSVAGQTSNTVALSVPPPHLDQILITDLEGHALDGLPTAGNCIAHLYGSNLDAENAVCVMNSEVLVVLEKNSTVVRCQVVESFEAQAIFSLQTSFTQSNEIAVNYLPPTITSISPLEGVTSGSEWIEIDGANLGCSESHKQSLHIHFGSVLIDSSRIASCSHSHLRFLSPEGQGREISLFVQRFGYSTQPVLFSYLPPRIESLSMSYVQEMSSPSYKSSLAEQPIFLLSGSNFGTHSTEVIVSDRNCAVIQQNHTSISCVAPFFFGGEQTISVVVSGQWSNSVNYTFPTPSVTLVDPLLVESVGSTIHLLASHLPPVSGLSMILQVGLIAVHNCHISLSSSESLHFVECHLPELPRGQWSLQLQIQSVRVPISEDSQILTVVCPQNTFAAIGQYCQACPSNAHCPTNATLPESNPGGWITEGVGGSSPTVDRCYNPSACVGGNQCLAGYQNYKCSQCSIGYSHYDKWTCTQCPAGVLKVFPLLAWVTVCIMLYAASASRYSARFAWYTILVDIFQLIGILSIFRSQFSPLLAPLLDFCSMFVLDMDLFHLDCYFSSIDENGIWILSLLTVLFCFVIEGLIRAAVSLSRRKDDWRERMGSVMTQGTSLLYVLFIPILYHAFQSLTCNNKYYMQSRLINYSGLSMCWRDADYSWILVVSLILLIGSIGGVIISYENARQERLLTEHVSSQAAKAIVLRDYSRRMDLLGIPFVKQSSVFLYASFAVKSLLVVLVVVFREESHLQSLFILLFVILLVVLILFSHPFETQHRHVTESLNRTTLESADTKNDYNFTKSTIVEKRWCFNVNYLLIAGLLLFACLYIDSILAISFVSRWRICIEAIVIGYAVLFVLCTVMSGVGELLFKNSNVLFDIVRIEENTPQIEDVHVMTPPEEVILKASKRNELYRKTTGSEEQSEESNWDFQVFSEMSPEEEKKIMEAMAVFQKKMMEQENQ